jgi:glycosyltransferase 2 family protein
VKSSTKSLVIGIGKYVLGFGLLAFVISQNWSGKGGAPGLKDLLQQTPDWVLVAAVLPILAFITAVQFYRWYLLVRAVELPFTLRNALRLGMVGYFYNAFLPGSIGGDIVKAIFIAKDNPERRTRAVATVIADRMLGLFGLLWMAAAVGGAAWASGDALIASNEYLQKIVIVCGGLAGAGVLVWIVLGLLSDSAADRFAARLQKLPAGKALSEAWQAGHLYRRRPRVIYISVALSAAAHVAMILLFHCTSRIYEVAGAGGPATLAEHCVICPVGYIAQALFPAPGGVGGAEGVFGFLYTLLNRSEVLGVVGRLVLRMAEWTLGFAGYITYLRMKHELPGEAGIANEQSGTMKT